MKQKDFLLTYVKIADLHTKRLQDALFKIEQIIPFSTEKLENLTGVEAAFLDQMTARFSQLQDVVGAKIFPVFLAILGEDGDAVSVLDRLNKLEKLGYIATADWWLRLREMRNNIAHEYPDHYERLAEQLNIFIGSVKEILRFWLEFREKVMVVVQ